MDDALVFGRLIKYSILQTTNVGSLFCDICVFIDFFRNWRKEIMVAPQNHVIFGLLVISFTQKALDLPFYLYYLRWGVVAQFSDTFCNIWNWLDFSLLTTGLHVLVWCCIERHLFVFHSAHMKQKRYLLTLHYLPMVGSMTYASSFYSGMVFFPPGCSNEWDYMLPLCGAACFAYLPFWGTFDWVFHYGIAVLIIILSNICLFIRIFWRKVRNNRLLQRKRSRRLIVQLTFIVTLFLLLLTPLISVGVIQALWIPMFMSDIQYDYFYYMSYFTNQFLPFAIVGSLPKMRGEIQEITLHVTRRCFGQNNPARIHPTGITMTIVGNHNATPVVPDNDSS